MAMMRRHPRQRLLLAFVLLCALLAAAELVLWPGRSDAVASAQAAAPTQVAVARVGRGAFPRYLEAIGELEAVQAVTLSAEVAGRIVELPVRSGQRVERGQLILRLNDAVQRGELIRLQGRLDNARTQLQRAQRLLGRNAISREAVDNARAEALAAEGALKSLQAQLEQRSIRAPFAGVLGIRRVHLGQYLSPGEAIINLSGEAGLLVNFGLPEQSMAQLQAGERLEVFLDALPQQAIAGRLSSIDPFVASTRNLRVQALLLEPPAVALPGMFARVRVQQAAAADTLTVPETAIAYSAYGETVYRLEPLEAGQRYPRVRRVAVSTGERRAGLVVIEEGLSADDRVVVAGQIKLHDGASIRPVADPALAAEAVSGAVPEAVSEPAAGRQRERSL
ncbi:efflux RND transporter periplasmic adaptor subunit [Pseudomonas sp. MBLB4123]|uniref:efflux RND transporter periplasmic adaptor subunit n=1 Tax=Pseudomonas sp. MBLB4123 TaxID=3451557 RepID=UPI003F74C5DD